MSVLTTTMTKDVFDHTTDVAISLEYRTGDREVMGVNLTYCVGRVWPWASHFCTGASVIILVLTQRVTLVLCCTVGKGNSRSGVALSASETLRCIHLWVLPADAASSARATSARLRRVVSCSTCEHRIKSLNLALEFQAIAEKLQRKS